MNKLLGSPNFIPGLIMLLVVTVGVMSFVSVIEDIRNHPPVSPPGWTEKYQNPPTPEEEAITKKTEHLFKPKWER